MQVDDVMRYDGGGSGDSLYKAVQASRGVGEWKVGSVARQVVDCRIIRLMEWKETGPGFDCTVEIGMMEYEMMRDLEVQRSQGVWTSR